jgi:hypothetical protein
MGIVILLAGMVILALSLQFGNEECHVQHVG